MAELDARIADLEAQLKPLKEERRRLRHAAAMAAAWSDPEKRARISAWRSHNKGKVLHISPEMREHLSKVRSENAKKQWTPEQKARQSEFMKEQKRTDPRMAKPAGAGRPRTRPPKGPPKKPEWSAERRALQAERMREQRLTDQRIARPNAKPEPNYYRDIDDAVDLSDIIGQRPRFADD